MDAGDPNRPLQSQQGIVTLRLDDEGLHVFDQRALPVEERWLIARTLDEAAEAIETLAVRGAPAIGGAAGLALAHVARRFGASADDLTGELARAEGRLARTRPTAVNLFIAIERCRAARTAAGDDVEAIRAAVVDAADQYMSDDARACERMGAIGAELFDDGDKILTVCHTGALATCGIGTALGVVRSAHEAGKRVEVYALETRPLLQGARLTAWECQKIGVPVTLITDGMAGFALRRRGITKAISGANRVAENGDTANKIGTYGLAHLARAHGVPFYVAAPTTTLDPAVPDGDAIVIEERSPDEIRSPRGAVFAPATVPVWNPAFDVTPAELIDGIITERGVWRPPYPREELARLLASDRPGR